ncbi:MAG: F0F1 ATP synthase subunit A [Deltaproteobacteria bacterium]|nr:F0F1 ATP synthase subunit A [Deltaproteobacteria bacterium]
MGHPFLIFPKIFEALGLGHFAHANIHVIYSWVAMAILLILGYLGAKSVKLIPGGAQNACEVVVTGIEEFMVDITGEEGRWLFPIAATVFLYILVSNLLGLIPGFFPPTADINTPFSCAIVVFVMTHFIGIKYHGAKYYKHFIGPMWPLIPLFLPIEIISHLARVLSLTFRLFGNLMGHELVLMILFFLAGAFFAPLPIMLLGVLVAAIQAFVFFMLSIMYFAGSMEHAH